MNNIVLIGFMGAGKSTVGKALAARFEFNFVDADEAIEKEEQRSISEIFSQDGETHFRQLEADFIKNQFHNVVLATGGGMPCHHENIDRLKTIGTTIYLQASPENLAQRLWLERKRRPLIKTIESVEELVEFINIKLTDRALFYEKADVVVEVGNKASCEVVDELFTLIKNLK